MPDKTQYMLVQDNDSHWYVIPADNRDAFDKWLDSEDAENGDVPTCVRKVGAKVQQVAEQS